MIDIENVIPLIQEYAIKYGGKILYCIIAYLILRIVFKYILKFTKAAMDRANAGAQISRLVQGIIKIVFYIIISLLLLATFEIPTTQLVALFSVVGVAFSLAIKDTLGNFAEGVIMMISKPFQAGDTIEVSGISGTVKSIELIYTRLITADNKNILIPNGELASATIINFSLEETRRLDMVLSINYRDIETARTIIKKTVEQQELALKDPDPVYSMSQQRDSVDITAKIWVKTENYSDLEQNLQEALRKAFSENKIDMPSSKMDICIVERAAN